MPTAGNPQNPLLGDLQDILAQTDAVWDQFDGKRVFLTGGTGFFGCWFLETFTHAIQTRGLKSSITVLTRDPAAFKAKAPRLAGHAAVTLHPGDIRTFEPPAGEFAWVVHAATPVAQGVNPLEMFDITLEGTRRTLELARKCGCEKFLYVSSGAVYGAQPGGVSGFSEDHLLAPATTNPQSAYGEGKRAGELLCAMYAEACKLDCKIARCFSFIGPYLPVDAHFAAGNFIRDVLRGAPIHIQGDGTPMRSYLYTSDMVVWLLTVLIRGQTARPYNIGSTRPVSILELARSVAKLASPQVPVKVAREPAPGALAARYVPDVSRAQSELGLTVRVDLEQALAKTFEWHHNVGTK